MAMATQPHDHTVVHVAVHLRGVLHVAVAVRVEPVVAIAHAWKVLLRTDQVASKSALSREDLVCKPSKRKQVM